VRALLAGGTASPPSGAVPLALGSALPPARPRNLLITADGSTIDLTWSLDDPGGRADAVVLEAGTSPGSSDLGTLTLPPGTTRFTAPPVPPGWYYVRVRQRGPAFTSDPSNEVSYIIPSACATPNPPVLLRYDRTGAAVRIAWDLPPVGSPAPTSWMLAAGSAPGLANLGSIPIAVQHLVASPGAGAYWIRVYAINACGVSYPSEDLSITVP
jgi:hypothetical protein